MVHEKGKRMLLKKMWIGVGVLFLLVATSLQGEEVGSKTYASQDLTANVVIRKAASGEGFQCFLQEVVAKEPNRVWFQGEGDLFQLHFRWKEEKNGRVLASTNAWEKIEWTADGIRLENPLGEFQNQGIVVEIGIRAEKDVPGIGWRLTASGSWEITWENGRTGVISLAGNEAKMTALFPDCSGTLYPDAMTSEISCAGRYPNLRTVMPWMALWEDSPTGSGFYLAAHDPTGAVKDLRMRHPEKEKKIRMEILYPFPIPLEKEGKNQVSTTGEVVWRTLKPGQNWYDAAVIYRDWVRENASWYPAMGPEGRVSTPMWLKRMCVLGRVFGFAKDVVPVAKAFRDFWDMPVGIHWYHWHQIPFDNDYPHYFPPKEGFREGVAELQKYGCYVFPYTNGRLWDTRDRGSEDWQYSTHGKLAACKDAAGEPRLERYRSLESDGSRVVLAGMCPGSAIWKEKLTENILTVVNEYGLNGVYMDQIGAVPPYLCYDRTHGHPLAGGSWWIEEYRKVLGDARRQVAPEKIFATECNAEIYVNLVDAMVCWHVEGKHVPAYAVVYSGVVFPYGRSYDKNAAMRMKWADTLVKGDIPGWFPPDFMKIPEMAEYLKPLVYFRHHTVEYFYKGELCRPPKLTGEVPVWSEDWNVFGRKSINTMSVVQCAARRILDYDYDAAGRRIWKSGKPRSALLIFTNFSDETVTSPVEIDWTDLGISPQKLERVEPDGKRIPMTLEELRSPLTFPAGKTWGIEAR